MTQETILIRVLLVEDHKIVREGTHQLLDEVVDFEVVGEAMDGIEATREIKKRYPEIQILILSAYEDDCYVFPLLEAGASGYLLKTASGHELELAIRTVQRGETALSPLVAHKVVRRMNRKQLYRSDEMCEGLTERELEVLKAVALGQSNKEIANTLSISNGTVQVHLRNIFSKMQVNGRTEAVTVAMSQGWISLPGEHGG